MRSAARAGRILSRRFRRVNLIACSLASLFALVFADAREQLVPVVGLAFVIFGAGRWARRRGLPESVLASPAAALGLAVVALVREALGAPPFQAAALPSVLVFLQSGLAIWDAIVGENRRLTARLRRGAAVLDRHQLGRVLVTAALAFVAVRSLSVALVMHLEGASVSAGLATVALLLLWRRPRPEGTLLSAVLLAAIPGSLALGMGTDHGLWAPLTRTVSACFGLEQPRTSHFALTVAVSGGLSVVNALIGRSSEDAPGGSAAAEDPEASAETGAP
jgi:hypothetical protein